MCIDSVTSDMFIMREKSSVFLSFDPPSIPSGAVPFSKDGSHVKEARLLQTFSNDTLGFNLSLLLFCMLHLSIGMSLSFVKLMVS